MTATLNLLVKNSNAHKETNISATVGTLLKYITPVEPEIHMTRVFELFLAQPELHSIPVVLNKVPIGLVSRTSFIEFFCKPYAQSLYGSKPISDFNLRDPVVVDHGDSIDDLARTIIDAGRQHVYDGFIITRDDKYVGVGTGHDLLNEITERKQSYLYHLAHFDQLTELPNRRLLMKRLACARAHMDNRERMMAVMFMDIDRFKLINDSYGHYVGDALLRAVADILKSCMRSCDTISRLSGDEFAIILEGLKYLDDATFVAQKIIDACSRSLIIDGYDLRVTISLGIVIYPLVDLDNESLLKMADVAMYYAKNKGGNTYQYYSHKMSESVCNRLYIENELRDAIKNNQLFLHYQPQIDLLSGEVIGVEALIRWQHHTLGAVSPATFIPIAEESGLIAVIGERVLRMACIQNKMWQDAGFKPVRMAVNLSACQMKHDLPELVQSVLNKTELNASYLELELTENTLLDNIEESITILRKLSDIGIQVSIDDFGTGYSSLSYLQRLPIDTLKIDASFLKSIQTESDDITIVATIIAMAKNMKLNVIAEGVETQFQLDMLRSNLCDLAQGYFISRPLPADKIEHFFESDGFSAGAM